MDGCGKWAVIGSIIAAMLILFVVGASIFIYFFALSRSDSGSPVTSGEVLCNNNLGEVLRGS